jgi:hypothetical protein
VACTTGSIRQKAFNLALLICDDDTGLERKNSMYSTKPFLVVLAKYFDVMMSDFQILARKKYMIVPLPGTIYPFFGSLSEDSA